MIPTPTEAPLVGAYRDRGEGTSWRKAVQHSRRLSASCQDGGGGRLMGITRFNVRSFLRVAPHPFAALAVSAYAAPELLSGQPPSLASDVFSFGLWPPCGTRTSPSGLCLARWIALPIHWCMLTPPPYLSLTSLMPPHAYNSAHPLRTVHGAAAVRRAQRRPDQLLRDIGQEAARLHTAPPLPYGQPLGWRCCPIPSYTVRQCRHWWQWRAI